MRLLGSSTPRKNQIRTQPTVPIMSCYAIYLLIIKKIHIIQRGQIVNQAEVFFDGPGVQNQSPTC